MKFETWRRRATPWLLLRPAEQESAWQWARIERGQVSAEGTGKPPLLANVQAALLLPGHLCSHFQLPAPPGLKRHEWPLLLEDRLLQPLQSLACGSPGRANGLLQLVCVDQAQLDAWLAQCAAWQLDVQRCWAEFQLLPTPEPGAAWCWQQERHCLFSGQSEQGRLHWLALPNALAQAAAPSIWNTLQVETLQGDWLERFADLDRLPSLFERRRGRRQPLPLNPAAWRMPAACMALLLLWGALWLGQQWQQQRVYEAQVAEVVGPAASLRQASQALKRQREAVDERQLRMRQLQHLQAQVDAWLVANGGWQLAASHFDGRRWSLQLQGLEPMAVEPWQALASESAVQVQVSQTADAVQLIFDLGAST